MYLKRPTAKQRDQIRYFLAFSVIQSCVLHLYCQHGVNVKSISIFWVDLSVNSPPTCLTLRKREIRLYQNRTDILSSMMRPNFTCGTNSTYHLVCDSFRRRGLLFYNKTLNVKIMHTHVLTLYGGNLSMTISLSCPSNKSSYFFQITLSAEHAMSKCYSSSTRFSLHLAYLHIWVMMT